MNVGNKISLKLEKKGYLVFYGRRDYLSQLKYVH